MTSELNYPPVPLAEANLSSKETLGFFVAGPDGYIAEANTVLLERLGMTQEALERENLLHCQSILSPESWTRWKQQWPDLDRQKFIAPLTVSFRSLDGDLNWKERLLSAQVSITALRDGSGNAGCIVRFDEPEQLAGTTVRYPLVQPDSALMQEPMLQQDWVPASMDDGHYFRMLTDASPAQIFDMAPDGKARFVNRTARDYYGSERLPEMMKGNWTPEVHPDDLENISQLLQQTLEGEREFYGIEMRLKRWDGVYRWFFNTGNRCYYPNGDFYGLVGYSIDITPYKEAELELKASEERFRIIADASPAHIFDMAPDGTFRFLNQAVMEFLSIERHSEIMEGRWDSEVHSDDLKNMTQLVQEALEGKRESYQLEFRSKQQDGVFRWFFHSGNRCYYPNGDFYGLVGYTIDISALKEAEFALRESETRWREMANVVPVMLWVSNAAGETVFINDWWYQYTGLSPDSSLDNQWNEIVHPDDRGLMLAVTQQYLKVEPFEIECRFRNVKGEYRWHLSRLLPVKDADGKILNWYGTSVDIHDRRIVEQELSKARDIAEEASKKKSQFMANMSHELRTPLNAVIGFSDMMKNGMAGPLTDKQNDYISHIATSGRHLLTLVNDILDIAKAEAGRVELFLQYIELEPFIQQLQELVRYSVESSDVSVTFELEPGLAGLVADPNRLKQIFMNLLSNAVKFNHRGGQVKISLARSEDKQWVICAIRDTGIGIPADKIDNLFNEFYQVDSSIARCYEGTGLGLSLAKRLVELHHGFITVESQVNVGSTFTFKLPLEPVSNPLPRIVQ